MKSKQLNSLLLLFLLPTFWTAEACTEDSVRLVQTPPGDPTQGYVEICSSDGEWDNVKICENYWDAREARVVCRELGFESATATAVEYAGSDESDLYFLNIECTGTELNVSDCSLCDDCHSDEPCDYAGVICYPNGTECNDTDIRLVGADVHDYFEGRVEICYRGLWGSVCGYQYDRSRDVYTEMIGDDEAGVICRQLGLPYYGVEISEREEFGIGLNTPIFLSYNVHCTGAENKLSDCSHNELNEHNCWHEGDLAITCLAGCRSGNIRIVGASRSEGNVELCINSEWEVVCTNYWDAREARVACRNLGFKSDTAIALESLDDGATSIHDRNYLECTGNEGSLQECPICSECSGNVCDLAGVDCYPEESDSMSECNDTDIRLVGGRNIQQGRVEFCCRGRWGSVCGYHYLWESQEYIQILGDEEAGVICRQLGFLYEGAMISTRGRFGSGRGKPIFLDNTSCNGTEERLSECSNSGINVHQCLHDSDVGVVCRTGCNDSAIRLMDGADESEGRIEICIDGIWGSICNNLWDARDARVVCRQLGYESDTAIAVGYNQVTQPIYRDYVNCSGNESSISECPSCSYCTRYYYTLCVDAGVICYPNGTECNDTDIRLVGGDGRHEGRLEICYGGVWGSVCGKHWNWPNNTFDNIFLRRTVAAVVCRQLGLSPDGAVLRISEYDTSIATPIFLDDTVCNGTEERLADCSHSELNVHQCWHSEAIGVACVAENATCVDGDVRLVGGQAPNEGRVEVCFNDQFGTICDDGWDQRDAKVVCFQLGFGKEDAYSVWAIDLTFGIGDGEIFLDNVYCNGREDYITKCFYPRVGIHNCKHTEDAGVICQPDGSRHVCYNGDVRLGNGRDSSEGRVEVCLNNYWSNVCNNGWGIQEAKVVCRKLGFSIGEGTLPVGSHLFGRGRGGVIIVDNLNCVGTETSLNDCPLSSVTLNDCSNILSTGVGVLCNNINETQCTDGSVRLVDRSSPYEGRVEVCFSNHWGTICDDSWDHTDAAVVCRQLNFGEEISSAVSQAFHGEGVGIIWLDDVNCVGNESSLINCGHAGVGINNCYHNEDAGVICSERLIECDNGEVRLVNGTAVNEGRVELCFDDDWGTICDTNWTMSNAEVVCRQLDFPGVASTRAFFGEGTGPILSYTLICAGNESNLLECGNNLEELALTSCNHSQDIGIVCHIPSTAGPDPVSSKGPDPVDSNSQVELVETAGIVTGVVCLVLLVGIVVVLVIIVYSVYQRRQKRKLQQTTLLLEEIVRNTNFESERNPYAETKFNRASSRDTSVGLLHSAADLLDELSEDFLIPSSDIRLMDTLGQGEYGIVYKAHLIKPMIAPREITNSEGEKSMSRKISRTSMLLHEDPTKPLTVAVKTLKGFFTEDDIKEMLRESNKMQQFDHPNVLSMMGICLDAGPAPYIVMPFMANGSLISYLKKDRPNLILPDDTDEDTVSATRKRMTDMCLQVAKGMEYLASMKLIHRDLAARNCMIDSDWIIKVADFGLSESTSTKDYFRQNEGSSVKLPIKWMAPESLSDGVFSEKTDVWSYGVTCWEVYTAGMTPYRGVHPLDVVGMLDCGKRLEKPHNAACCDLMYSIMTSCWEFNPKDRPHFSQLINRITKVLETLSDYLDVSTFQFSAQTSSTHDSQPINCQGSLSTVAEESEVIVNKAIEQTAEENITCSQEQQH